MTILYIFFKDRIGRVPTIFILIFATISTILLSMFLFQNRPQQFFSKLIRSNAAAQLNKGSNTDVNIVMNHTKVYFQEARRNFEQEVSPPWVHAEANKTLKSFSGQSGSQGIVICTGNGHFLLSLIALEALRLVENKLPIEVIFSSSSDLSLTNQQILASQFPEVELTDLSTIFNNSFLRLHGFAIKPFSVLASRFQHVLLMDADVLFLEQPSILFENEFYRRTGSLFFYDRSVLSMKARKWIAQMAPYNKKLIPKRAQESGVVLVDKGRVLLGLLGTCKLNEHEQREKVTYKHVYGDKDTWWLGFYLVGMPYSFIPTLTAAIGQIKRTKVCGHMLHLDQNNKPIWWNGGTFRNRYINTYEILSMEGWLEAGVWSVDVYSCLNNNKKLPNQFMGTHKHLINRYLEITKQVFNISSTKKKG